MSDAFRETDSILFRQLVTFQTGFGVIADEPFTIGSITSVNSPLVTYNQIIPYGGISGFVSGASGLNNQIQYNNSGNLAGNTGFIFSNGKLGINIPSPKYSIDVNSGIGNSSGSLVLYAGYGTTGGPNTNILLLPQFLGGNNGYVGIGQTNPQYTLDLNGSIGNSYYGNGNYITIDDSQGNINIQGHFNKGIFLQCNYIGVNTSSPVYTLDVNGSGHFNNGLFVGSYPVVTSNQTGIFYLSSNPSGFITGFNSGLYTLNSNTGYFITTGQTGAFGASGSFYPLNSNPSGYIIPSQTGAFYSSSNPNSYVSSSNRTLSDSIPTLSIDWGNRLLASNAYSNTINWQSGVLLSGTTISANWINQALYGNWTITGGTETITNTGSINFIVASGNYTGYQQINVINSSSGTTASADLVCTNNIGSESGYYIDVGINSSKYTGQFVGASGDSYTFSHANDYYLGNAITGNRLYLFAGNTPWLGTQTALTIFNNKIGIGGNINPIYTLDVSGSGNFSNGLYVSGSAVITSSQTGAFGGSSTGNYMTTGQAVSTWTNLTCATTTSWTAAAATVRDKKILILTGNSTLNITSLYNGWNGILKIVQSGSNPSGNELTMPAGAIVVNGGAGAVTLTSNNHATDVLNFDYDGTNLMVNVFNNFN